MKTCDQVGEWLIIRVIILVVFRERFFEGEYRVFFIDWLFFGLFFCGGSS